MHYIYTSFLKQLLTKHKKLQRQYVSVLSANERINFLSNNYPRNYVIKQTEILAIEQLNMMNINERIYNT